MNLSSLHLGSSQDKLLEVPFYSQFEKGNGLNRSWQERSCGILALKMIFDYYRKVSGEPAVNLKELLAVALEQGGVDKQHNWYHAALVGTAKHYGYLAWRRSWVPSARDIERFKQEGVDKGSLARWQQQLRKEAVCSLVHELENGYPVIVSAAPNFGNDKKSHLMTLIGFKQSKGGVLNGFYYQDPYNRVETTKEERYVALDQFEAIWTYRAVFVRPQES